MVAADFEVKVRPDGVERVSDEVDGARRGKIGAGVLREHGLVGLDEQNAVVNAVPAFALPSRLKQALVLPRARSLLPAPLRAVWPVQVGLLADVATRPRWRVRARPHATS